MGEERMPAIVEMVKDNGRPDVFAWQYPEDGLDAWTQVMRGP
jgi:hypothetical protein